ncbi:MAG: glycosyltransferase family 39 protein, partial [Anaerolineae bacterium]
MGPRDRRHWMLVVLYLAWGMWLYHLRDVPYGLHHDATFNLVDTIEVLHGRLRLYFPANFGREPLFIYSTALMARGLGADWIWVQRLTSVVWGLLGLASAYPLMRRLVGPRAAGWGTALMAGSFWLLMVSRLGLRSVTLLLFANLAAFTILKAMEPTERRSTLWWLSAGVAGGLAQYTYLAARALFILPAGPLLWAGRSCRTSPRSLWHRITGPFLAGGIMVALYLPLHVAMSQSALPSRLGELDAPLRMALAGHPLPLLEAMGQTVLALFWRGPEAPSDYLYNVPGRPALSPLLVLAFAIGLGILLMNRQGRRTVPWLAFFGFVGLLPDLLSSGGPLYLRGVMALPYLLAVVGTGVDGICTLLRRRAGRLGGAAGMILALALLGWQYGESAYAYFREWALAPQTLRIYNGDLRALADSAPAVEGTRTFISTDFWLDLDQQTFQFLSKHPETAEWFHIRHGLPLPADGGAVYWITLSTPLPAEWQGFFRYASQRLMILGPDGHAPLATGYVMRPADIQAGTAALGLRPLEETVTFGELLDLAAARAEQSGDDAVLWTLWRVAGAGRPSAPAHIVAELTGMEGYVWNRSDLPLGCAHQSWREGDHCVQVTRLTMAGDMPPGEYAVRAYLYIDPAHPLAMRAGGNFLAAPPRASAFTVMDLPAGPLPAAPYPVEGTAGGRLAPLGGWEKWDKVYAGVPYTAHLRWIPTEDLETSQFRFVLRALADDGAILWEGEAPAQSALPAIWPAGHPLRLTHRFTLGTADMMGNLPPVTLQICAMWDGEVESCA